jgi:hypothetical protein
MKIMYWIGYCLGFYWSSVRRPLTDEEEAEMQIFSF